MSRARIVSQTPEYRPMRALCPLSLAARVLETMDFSLQSAQGTGPRAFRPRRFRVRLELRLSLLSLEELSLHTQTGPLCVILCRLQERKKGPRTGREGCSAFFRAKRRPDVFPEAGGYQSFQDEKATLVRGLSRNAL